MSIRVIAKKLDKNFSEWNYDKAIKYSTNETNTRDYLVEPFFQILEYRKIDDYRHEFGLKYPDGNVKLVDMAITLNSKNPKILIECKKAQVNLSSKHFGQLSSYYKEHKESQIGILTNGIIYKFFSRSLTNRDVLNKTPFFEFNLKSFSFSDLEKLAAFNRTEINVNDIVEKAEEIYFEERFEDALYQTLRNRSRSMRKLIFENMDIGSRMTDKISKNIYDLITFHSYEQAIEKIRVEDSYNKNKGIITTLEEMESFQTICTLLSVSRSISQEHLDRIGYKDYKGHFKVIVDNMPSKEICSLILKDSNKILNIGADQFILNSLSPKSFAKYKKKLTDSALSRLS